MSAARRSLAAWLLVLAWTPAAHAKLLDSKHNLSASGPGSYKTTETEQPCVFCHTPHRAAGSRALWNRDAAPVTYQLYESSTLAARPGQPTGSSRLCLSCHDGLTAMGSLRVPPRSGRPPVGPLGGAGALGTDLSDDHPVSFVYDSRLAAEQTELADPASLPSELPLDRAGQLQCTTCHDPHENQHRKFLRMEDRGGALCVSCHRLQGWQTSAHATSTASTPSAMLSSQGLAAPAAVAEQACQSCHRVHAAPQPRRLLAQADDAQVCWSCHAGDPAPNLQPEFLKMSAHPSGGSHDAAEDPRTMPRHATCVDCHNPHRATAAGPAVGTPGRSGALAGAPGMSITGVPLREAAADYEVCLRCHGTQPAQGSGIERHDNIRAVAEEFNPANVSAHPVVTPGTGTLRGLLPGAAVSGRIGCTDCHNNDAPGPRGPHGSRFAPILAREYEQEDPVTESFQSYALCYRCHDRGALLSGGRFPHQKHLEHGASCAACHDAHGSRLQPRLINFMRATPSGARVVEPARSGVLEFRVTEPGRGECTLTCHGEEHDRRNY